MHMSTNNRLGVENVSLRLKCHDGMVKIKLSFPSAIMCIHGARSNLCYPVAGSLIALQVAEVEAHI